MFYCFNVRKFIPDIHIFIGKTADSLVGCVSLAIKEAVNHCRECPPTGWPQTAYTLIGREDLAQQKEKNADWSHSSHITAQSMAQKSSATSGGKEEEDGMEHLDHQVNSFQKRKRK